MAFRLPLSVPAEGSIVMSITVGEARIEEVPSRAPARAIASPSLARSSAGSRARTPTAPSAAPSRSCRALSSVGAGSREKGGGLPAGDRRSPPYTPPLLKTKTTKFLKLKRAAVSTSHAEKPKAESPSIAHTTRSGHCKAAAIAYGMPTPMVPQFPASSFLSGLSCWRTMRHMSMVLAPSLTMIGSGATRESTERTTPKAEKKLIGDVRVMSPLEGRGVRRASSAARLRAASACSFERHSVRCLFTSASCADGLPPSFCPIRAWFAKAPTTASQFCAILPVRVSACTRPPRDASLSTLASPPAHACLLASLQSEVIRMKRASWAKTGGLPRPNIQLSCPPTTTATSQPRSAEPRAADAHNSCESGSTPLPIGSGTNGASSAWTSMRTERSAPALIVEPAPTHILEASCPTMTTGLRLLLSSMAASLTTRSSAGRAMVASTMCMRPTSSSTAAILASLPSRLFAVLAPEEDGSSSALPGRGKRDMSRSAGMSIYAACGTPGFVSPPVSDALIAASTAAAMPSGCLKCGRSAMAQCGRMSASWSSCWNPPRPSSCVSQAPESTSKGMPFARAWHAPARAFTAPGPETVRSAAGTPLRSPLAHAA
mmetsp:Transcript_10750/g.44434  ORF Transcript_10750/g.44434 Transcript_10750/m.44434 type:complete len:602 (+) Transcript_10750:1397-3202(+)